jgi:hypothetical protein
LSTSLWAYVVLNEAMPVLTREQAELLTDDPRLVLPVVQATTAERAGTALAHASYSFVVAQQGFGMGDGAFTALLADLVRTPAAEQTD